MINKIPSCSFKSYVPVTYYAKNPDNNEYSQIISKDNMRKCQSFVVRNLNGTAQNMKNPQFVQYYKQQDRSYANNPVVHSVYDNSKPVVYMVTGNDVDVVKEYAKNVGKAKSDSMYWLGHSKSYESRKASKDYFREVKSFLKNSCRRLKNDAGENLSLRVYFDPQYTRTGNLKGFQFVNARFVKDAE